MYNVKDASGATFAMSSTQQGDGSQAPNVVLMTSTNAIGKIDADGTIVTAAAMPTGGVGLLGWLSAIWFQLTQYLSVNLGLAGSPVSATNPIPIIDGYQAPVAATWNSATALNQAITLTTSGYDTVIVSHVSSGTITGGATTFEAYDGTNWIPIKAASVFNYTTNSTYLLTGGQAGFQVPVAGFPQFRVRLSTAITGSGTITMAVINSSAPDTSVVTAGLDPSQPLPAGNLHIGQVGGAGVKVVATTITRPANTTAYAALAAISNSTTAPSTLQFSNAARTNGGSGYITKVVVGTSQTTNTARYRLHFYNTAPTAINDGSGCSAPLTADFANYLGSIDLPAMVAGTGANLAYAENIDSRLHFVCNADANLYALLENLDAFTPASAQTYQISIMTEQD